MTGYSSVKTSDIFFSFTCVTFALCYLNQRRYDFIIVMEALNVKKNHTYFRQNLPQNGDASLAYCIAKKSIGLVQATLDMARSHLLFLNEDKIGLGDLWAVN